MWSVRLVLMLCFLSKLHYRVVFGFLEEGVLCKQGGILFPNMGGERFGLKGVEVEEEGGKCSVVNRRCETKILCSKRLESGG